MKCILIIGAGRSSTALIQYLKVYAEKAAVLLMVADADLQLASSKSGNDSAHVQPLGLDVFNEEHLLLAVGKADVVVSMVPPDFHFAVANACIQLKKNLLSASYLKDDILSLQKKAVDAGIIILMECGLDPGLDHMTAMAVIKRIEKEGGVLQSFKSFTGGLVAPDSDNNPWHYKFSWNPRNVVMAGQGTASYISRGVYKYIPYHKLFSRTEPIFVEGLSALEGYANRDSLVYRKIYAIENIPTLLRGTIRRKGFCAAWNIFVQLGLTDDSYYLEGIEKMNKRDLLNAFLPYHEEATVEQKLCAYTGIPAGGEEFQKIEWLGFFKPEPLSLARATPAQALQSILEQKWRLEPHDKDMVVMQHKFEYSRQSLSYELTASLLSIGDDQQQTAMAKTVGWPLGIAARLILENKISRRGVCIPVTPDIYEPVLSELEDLGIRMVEKEVPLD